MNKKTYFLILSLAIFSFTKIFSQDTSKSLGKIEGNIDVSATGGAVYTIPIAVPPGTKGMQPNITLTYNSQAGIGMMGKGWNISGLSAISRGGKTFYHDNKNEKIKFDDTDHFISDGMTLIPVNGSNGAEGTEYRTEIESYVRFYSRGRIGNSPERFEAQMKNGSIAEYGSSPNSRYNTLERNNNALEITEEPLTWNISKITDEFGNYMTFTYINNSTTGDFLISEIKYTGNVAANQAPYNKVVFEYEDYANFVPYYFDGVQYRKTKRLKRIKTYVENDQLVKTYEIFYGTNTLNSLFSVSEIKEINDVGEELNSTKFNWDLSDIWTFDNNSTVNGLNFDDFNVNMPANTKAKFAVGDIDGNGYTDIVVIGNRAGNAEGLKIYYYKNDGGSFDLLKEDACSDLISNFVNNGSNYFKFLTLIDWDKDGRDELWCFYNMEFRIYKWDDINNTFKKISQFSDGGYLNTMQGGYFYGNSIVGYPFTEINGDGIIDLLRVSVYPGYFYYRFGNYDGSLNPINNNGGSSQPSLASLDLNACRILTGDVNGDGMSDIIYFLQTVVRVSLANGNGFDPPTVWSTNFTANDSWTKANDIQIVDINGDGMADIAGFGNAQFIVHLSNGKSGFVEASSYFFDVPPYNSAYPASTIPDASYCPNYFLDLNNDGLIDILKFTLFNTYCYLNTGNSFVMTHNSNLCSGKYKEASPRIISDFNGDKLADIMQISQNGSTKIYYGGKNDNILLNTITDSYNNKIAINYNFYRNSYYGQEFSYPFGTISTIELVNNVKYISMNNIVSDKQYVFKESVYNYRGRGNLGFRNLEIKDLINQTTTCKYFVLNSNVAFLLPLCDTFRYDLISDKYISTAYTFDISNINNFKINKTKEIITDLFGLNKNETLWDYDLNGNITKETKTIFDINNILNNNQTTKIIAYTSVGNYNFKISGIGTTIRKGRVIEKVDSTKFEYNGNKLTRQRKIFTNDTLNYDIEYDITQYDFFGNPKKIYHKTIRPSMIRPTTLSYDSKGRWILTEVNHLNNVTSYIYEPKYGNCIQKTVKGATSKYEFNNWGKLVKTTSPEGDTINITYLWDNSIPDALYKIQTISNITGSSYKIYDYLDREIQSYSNRDNLNGVFYDTRYNIKGLLLKKSQPFTSTTTENNKIWTEYTYDNRNRILTETGSLIDNQYTYNDGNNSISIFNNLNSSTSTKQYDYLGRVIKATDAGGEINYTYTLSGKITKIVSNNNTTTILYDEAGNRKSLTEPNSGTIATWYNGFGDITVNCDNKSIVTRNNYNTKGQLVSKIISDNTDSQISNYTYFTSGEISSIGLLSSVITNTPNCTISYQYDNLTRLKKETQIIDGHSFVKDITYNNKGLVSEVKYPSYDNIDANRIRIQYTYNNRGKLSQINKDQNMLWQLGSCNELGMPYRVTYGNNTGTKFQYDENYQLKAITSGTLVEPLPNVPGQPFEPRPLGILISLPPAFMDVSNNIQRLYYGYNNNGLMNYRADSITNQKEIFNYDNLNRLTSITLPNQISLLAKQTDINYNNIGNILIKDDVGEYNYSINNPNAVTGIENSYNGAIPYPLMMHTINTEELNTTYNIFNKISNITQGNKELSFIYNPYQQRIKTIYKENNAITKTKYFVDDYECIISPNGNVKELVYIPTPYGATIIDVKENISNNVTDSIYYILVDHLRSYDVVVNQLGQVRERYSFDAWGNRRMATNWGIKDQSANHLFDRGFTGHEHLDCFELINMNGRLYDPVLGRFLSPDNFVQVPDFTQSFNRYSYCLNNPLMYTDPSGEWFGIDDLVIAGAGFIFNYVGYGISNDDWGLNAIGAGALGAVSAWIGFNTAGMATGALNSNTWMQIGCMAVNTVGNSLMPPMTIPLGENAGLNLSVGIGLGANGKLTVINSLNFYSTDGDGNTSIYFGLGASEGFTSYGGGFTIEGYGASYYSTLYTGNYAQTTGRLTLNFDKVSFSLENDFLSGTGDKWRTNAFELSVGEFVFGGNIFTNAGEAENTKIDGTLDIDTKALSPIYGANRPKGDKPMGAWKIGKVYSSPLWVGYKKGNFVTKIGYSHKVFQDLTQNGVHKWVPFGRQQYYLDYSEFKTGFYNYSGYNNPYSLY
ncbi:MAG: hypothetical protein H6Q16_239 [Bacteroidetes bacterium]|nr:hypothetical protein [Bacteroidota bacterium]